MKEKTKYPSWFYHYRPPLKPREPQKPSKFKDYPKKICMLGDGMSFKDLIKIILKDAKVSEKELFSDIENNDILERYCIDAEMRYDYNSEYTELYLGKQDEKKPATYQRELKKYEKQLETYNKKLKKHEERQKEWEKWLKIYNEEQDQKKIEEEKKLLKKLQKKYSKT